MCATCGCGDSANDHHHEHGDHHHDHGDHHHDHVHQHTNEHTMMGKPITIQPRWWIWSGYSAPQ